MSKKALGSIVIAALAGLALSKAMPILLGQNSTILEKKNDELIQWWQKGYISTCVTTNMTHDAILGKGFSLEFCKCMAKEYLAHMTTTEAVEVTKTGELPQRLITQRTELQNQCADRTADQVLKGAPT